MVQKNKSGLSFNFNITKDDDSLQEIKNDKSSEINTTIKPKHLNSKKQTWINTNKPKKDKFDNDIGKVISKPEKKIDESLQDISPSKVMELSGTTELEVIRSQIAPNATDHELYMLCSIANRLELNVFLHEIWFVKYKSKKTNTIKKYVMIGRDGWLRLLKRDGNFISIYSDTVYSKDKFIVSFKNGIRTIEHTYDSSNNKDRGELCKAYAWINMKNNISISVIVPLDEKLSTTNFWEDKPETMLKKCAEHDAAKLAVRELIPYCSEELGIDSTEFIQEENIDSDFKKISLDIKLSDENYNEDLDLEDDDEIYT